MRWGVCILLLGACSPPVTYQFKERVIERVAPALPAIHVDRFKEGAAIGKVDLLFIVDNTRSFDRGLEKFQETYTRFLGRLSAPALREVDYRVQLVTTPRSEMPADWVARDKPAAKHLGQLFDGVGSEPGIPLLSTRLRQRDNGSVEPFASLKEGVGGGAFAGRAFSPLYLVFVLGEDITGTYTQTDGVVKTANEELAKTRNLKTLGLLTLSVPTAFGGTSRSMFPGCRFFGPTYLFLYGIERFPSRWNVKADLCDKDWSNWDKALFEDIVAFKKRKVLTHVPYEPSTMQVRSGGRTYRYEDHYQFDAVTNSIVFNPSASLESGDLIEVSYFLAPVAPQLSGSQTPPYVPGQGTRK